jgi:hypothetical protein
MGWAMNKLILLLLTVPALAGCSTFTVRGDVSRQVAGDWQERIGTRDVTNRAIARLSLGFEPQLTETISAGFGIEHRSYPGTNSERGEERAYVGLSWRPFTREGRD